MDHLCHVPEYNKQTPIMLTCSYVWYHTVQYCNAVPLIMRTPQLLFYGEAHVYALISNRGPCPPSCIAFPLHIALYSAN